MKWSGKETRDETSESDTDLQVWQWQSREWHAGGAAAGALSAVGRCWLGWAGLALVASNPPHAAYSRGS